LACAAPEIALDGILDLLRRVGARKLTKTRKKISVS
jgi:hypothetical protein